MTFHITDTTRPTVPPKLSTKTAIRRKVAEMREAGQTVVDLPPAPERPAVSPALTTDPVLDAFHAIAERRAVAAWLRRELAAMEEEIGRMERAAERLCELREEAA